MRQGRDPEIEDLARASAMREELLRLAGWAAAAATFALLVGLLMATVFFRREMIAWFAHANEALSADPEPEQPVPNRRILEAD